MSYTANEKNAYFWDAFQKSQNGFMDFSRYSGSEYAAEIDYLNTLRFRFEEDPAGKEITEYYRNLGIKKELYDDGDFYERFAVFTPIHDTTANPDGSIISVKKLPVIFWNHGGGNDIITDEFSCHICQMAAKEQFIVVMLQNTNWENLDRKIDFILENYPADPERIYAMGYSQGGQTVHTAALHIPKRLAAAAPCGAEAFCLVDNLNNRYTMEQIEQLSQIRLPIIQINGCCEFLQFLPMNKWRPIHFAKGGHPYCLWESPRNNHAIDPTNPPNNGRPEKPLPPVEVDMDTWKLKRMDLRLAVQGCKKLDIHKCLGYQELPETDYHSKMGFYGEKEEVRTYYGVEHYIYNYYSKDGLNMYRYIGVDNAPHWPLTMLGELCWEFFRQFKRDLTTGKIVVDPYLK